MSSIARLAHIALALSCALGCDRRSTPDRNAAGDASAPGTTPEPPPPPPAPSSTSTLGGMRPQSWELPGATAVALDRRRVAVAHAKGVSFFDPHTGVSLGPPLEIDGTVERIAFGPDGERVAMTARLRKKKKHTPTTALYVHAGGEGATVAAKAVDLQFVFSPTTRQVLTTRWGDVEVRDERGAEVAYVLPGEGRVTALAMRSDGAQIAIARRQNEAAYVELWEMRTRALLQRINCADTQVRSLAWSADWSRLAWTEEEGEPLHHHVAVMDREGHIARATDALAGASRSVVLSGDGQWLMSLSTGPTLWRTADVLRQADLRPGRDTTWGAAFAAAPDRVALFTDSELRLVDVETGRTLARREVSLGPKSSAHAFSADGTWLLAASEVKTMLVPLPSQ